MSCILKTIPIDDDMMAGTQWLADAYREVTETERSAVLQECAACGVITFPPQLHCRACTCAEKQWHVCGSDLHVATWVTVHGGDVTPSMSIPRRLRDRLPYSTVFLNVAQHPGVRIPALYLSGTADQPDGQLAAGCRAVIRFNEIGGRLLPVCDVVT